MLSIREARPGDETVIAGLIRELAEYEKLLHEAEAGPEDLRCALFDPNPKAFCDIAEWDGAAVGMALWFYNFSTFRGRHGIYLEDLFVQPTHRGKGIGKALIAGLARRCVVQGLARLEWAVLDWNVSAIAFYKGLGAKVMDDWRICRLTNEALRTVGEDA